MTDVFTGIMESLRDNLCVVPLKVALLPALGEFMFYAATQEEGEDKRITNWDPPGKPVLTEPILIDFHDESE